MEAFKLGGPLANQGMKLSSQVKDPVELPVVEPGTNAWHRRLSAPALASEHHNLTLSIIGTAIRLREDAPSAVRATRPVLSLRDGRLVPRMVSTGEATFE